MKDIADQLQELINALDYGDINRNNLVESLESLVVEIEELNQDEEE